MIGRTSWWAHDAALHRRERMVELGEEFGPAGPHVVSVLRSLAQEQGGSGEVKTGFRALGRETFVDADKVREIVEAAANLGELDDLVLDDDGRRFTCRISGWASEQQKGRAAARKADQRAREEAEQLAQQRMREFVAADRDKTGRTVTSHAASQDVPLHNQTGQDREREGDARDRVPIDPEQPLAALDAIAATGNPKWRGAWDMGDSGEVLRLLLVEPPAVQLHVVERLRDEAPRWKGAGIRSSVQSWLIPQAQQAVLAANQRETAARRHERSQSGESRRDELKRIAAGGAVVEGRVAS